MNGIPWVLVTLVLLGIIVVVAIRKRKQPRRIDHRMYFVKTWFMTQFAVGLAIAIVAALMMFCQERCFLGLDLEFWPAVLGIIGIGLFAASWVHLLHA